MSFTLIITLTSLRKSKTRSIGTYSKDKVHYPSFSILVVLLSLHHEKIPPPFALLPLISVQHIMYDRNHQLLNKVRCPQPRNSYAVQGGLSSSQFSPHLSSHLTCLMGSNWRLRAFARHMKKSNCGAYTSAARAS